MCTHMSFSDSLFNDLVQVLAMLYSTFHLKNFKIYTINAAHCVDVKLSDKVHAFPGKPKGKEQFSESYTIY